MTNRDDARPDETTDETIVRERRSLGVIARSSSLVPLVLLLRVAAGCSDDLPFDRPCTNIPAGGCPLAYGRECDDPSCEAAYACREGNRWELDRVCPARDAGVSGDAASDAGPGDAASASPDAAPPPDAPEGAYGGPGCPPLQSPDCMVGFALACPSDCCECEDLFVCRNGAWYEWGVCEDGRVVER